MILQSHLKLKDYNADGDKTSNTYRQIWVYVNFKPIFSRNIFVLY